MGAVINRDAAKEMLGMGMKAVNVAAALGCDPSYISQLLAEPGFAQEVAAKRIEHAKRGAEADELADDIELSALKQLKRMMGFVTKPMDLLRIAEGANKLKRRTASDLQPSSSAANIVNVILPPVMVKNFTVSENNEVIEVDGQSLLTLPSQNFRQMVKDGRLVPAKEIEHEHEAELPGLDSSASSPP